MPRKSLYPYSRIPVQVKFPPILLKRLDVHALAHHQTRMAAILAFVSAGLDGSK